jgi:hypothetical protein
VALAALASLDQLWAQRSRGTELDVTVTQVSIKDDGGYRLLSVAEFLALPPQERTNLILRRKIDFLGPDGRVLPMLDAVHSINKARAAAAR